MCYGEAKISDNLTLCYLDIYVPTRAGHVLVTLHPNDYAIDDLESINLNQNIHSSKVKYRQLLRMRTLAHDSGMPY